MSLETKIFSIAEIDLDKVVALHRAAFSDVLDARDASRIHRPDYFRWKWSSPKRSGVIAVICDQDRYVAMNAMTWNPLKIKTQSQVQTRGAWLSCDTATDPAYRGRGLFSQCVKALASRQSPDEIFAGFPNGQSLPGFIKGGWQSLANLATYVKPVFPKFRDHQIWNRISEEKSFANFEWIMDGEISFSRDVDWLRWRYLDCPENPYRVFRIEAGSCSVFVIVRKYERKGLPFLVVMDWLRTTLPFGKEDSRDFDSAFVSVALNEIGRKEGCQFLFVQSSLRPFYVSGLSGWFRLPDFFLPKKQIFAGHFPPDLLSRNFSMDLKLGDWDGL